MNVGSYDYIRHSYGAVFYPGDTVEHAETQKRGKIVPPNLTHRHYVQVEFDERGPVNCHPSALKIIARGKAWEQYREATE
ncbi:hypothetical protein [Limimaricola cinnabarinus]|uniref:hypothetical protein n=1 Tax=Limimaricola cinnabarinus TaxID=1125964 RepID=UPI00248F5E5E|nr:hypothetical protein [Limimaricola cinnabarinus]